MLRRFGSDRIKGKRKSRYSAYTFVFYNIIIHMRYNCIFAANLYSEQHIYCFCFNGKSPTQDFFRTEVGLNRKLKEERMVCIAEEDYVRIFQWE